MTCICIELVTAPPRDGSVSQLWRQEEREHARPHTFADPETGYGLERRGAPVTHLTGTRHFEDGELPEVAASRARAVFEDARCPWFRIRSHRCDHDEAPNERSGCSDWTVHHEHGTIPEGI